MTLIGQSNSNFLRRFKFFGFGLLLGCLLAWALLIRGRDLSFWLPGNRVLDKLIRSKQVYSSKAECQLTCFHLTRKDVEEVYKTGSVNFSESNVHGEKNPVYILYGKEGSGIKITVSSVDSTANILSVLKTNSKDTCSCN